MINACLQIWHWWLDKILKINNRWAVKGFRKTKKQKNVALIRDDDEWLSALFDTFSYLDFALTSLLDIIRWII